jgi:light-regulated signal transduction histidine kinase (bacteriophytochrome)
MQISSHIGEDFPDLVSSRNLQIISGLLYVPLSTGGQDFIAFLRKGQSRQVNWAGKPYKDGKEKGANLEPRQSFKVWSETIAGKSKNWTDEQLETAGVLALVYGKFIEVWRQKESALKANQMTSLLLSNATHEGKLSLAMLDTFSRVSMLNSACLNSSNPAQPDHQVSCSGLPQTLSSSPLTRSFFIATSSWPSTVNLTARHERI